MNLNLNLTDKSIYKQWEDQLEGKVTADFKKGVLEALRALKEEVYNLKIDRFNQQQGRVIHDDKRIILSAPEIIIGDVNLGGILNPNGNSKIIIRGNEVNLQGVGDEGQVEMRAPVITQTAENPGVDGNEHAVGSLSAINCQAGDITLQSDTVKKGGALPPLSPISGGGIRINSDRKVDIRGAKCRATRIAQLEKHIKDLEGAKPSLDEEVEHWKGSFKNLRKEIESLMEKKSKLGNNATSIRREYMDLETLNIRIEELSTELSQVIYNYTSALSMLSENARLTQHFKDEKDKLSKISDDAFKKNSTKTAVSITGETINLASMDGDGNLRTNKKAGVNVMTNDMVITGKFDEKGSLPETNRLFVNMHEVEVSTAGAAGVKMNEKDELETAEYKCEGDFIVRSKNITLESMDYEVAEKKRKEKVLTADGSIKMRSKKIDLSTANSANVEVDEKGKLTKAKYTAEGDVTINTKTFALTAIDQELESDKLKETALTKDGKFSVRTENIDFAATDTDGKSTGRLTANAKKMFVKAMDVDKESRADSKLAADSKMLLLAEKMYVGAISKDQMSKSIQAMSEQIGLLAKTTLEAQQNDGKAMLQLADGNAAVAGGKTQVYGDTTINAKAEVKGDFKAPKATIDNVEAKSSFTSPNISDGMAVPAAGANGSLSAKIKAEDAPKE